MLQLEQVESALDGLLFLLEGRGKTPPGIIRQVAAIVTTGKTQDWKFTPEFLRDPAGQLSLAFGVAVNRAKKKPDHSATKRPGWDIRLQQYEKALAMAREYRRKHSKGRGNVSRQTKLAADVSDMLSTLSTLVG